MSQPWPYPGARWWKFDFHTHTPASKDTGAWQEGIGTPQELTPHAWLLKYMSAGIDCMAVTDHNTGEWIDALKAAYAEMKQEADAGSPPVGFRELHLFPGVEISVLGGFHLLAIFAPSATSQTISDLLARVDYDGNHLIYGLVVQQIRSNKLRRQLIIVTHNPNIVVNGDAELIHVLDFNHQCHVKQTGSLQDQAMRREAAK